MIKDENDVFLEYDDVISVESESQYESMSESASQSFDLQGIGRDFTVHIYDNGDIQIGVNQIEDSNLWGQSYKELVKEVAKSPNHQTKKSHSDSDC